MARKKNMYLESKSYTMNSSIEDKHEGIVHAVVSVFGVKDIDNDIVCKGAFKPCIEKAKDDGRLPPGVFHHDWTKPVAKTLDAWETSEGLHVVGQFNLETQRGRETFSDIKAGIIDEYSFGFKTLKSEKKNGIRHITEIEWYEWSPVLIGANRATHTVQVKSNNPDLNELQKQLGELANIAGSCLVSPTLEELQRLKRLIGKNLDQIEICLADNLQTSNDLRHRLMDEHFQLLQQQQSFEKMLVELE